MTSVRPNEDDISVFLSPFFLLGSGHCTCQWDIKCSANKYRRRVGGLQTRHLFA